VGVDSSKQWTVDSKQQKQSSSKQWTVDSKQQQQSSRVQDQGPLWRSVRSSFFVAPPGQQEGGQTRRGIMTPIDSLAYLQSFN
jgi:hypothetical protein